MYIISKNQSYEETVTSHVCRSPRIGHCYGGTTDRDLQRIVYDAAVRHVCNERPCQNEREV